MTNPKEQQAFNDAIFILSQLNKISAELALALDLGYIEDELGDAMLMIDDMLESIERCCPTALQRKEEAMAKNKAKYQKGWGE